MQHIRRFKWATHGCAVVKQAAAAAAAVAIFNYLSLGFM
jgi:hypothetical protein